MLTNQNNLTTVKNVNNLNFHKSNFPKIQDFPRIHFFKSKFLIILKIQQEKNIIVVVDDYDDNGHFKTHQCTLITTMQLTLVDDDDDYDDDNFVWQLNCPRQEKTYVLPTCLKGFDFKEHHFKDWIDSKPFKFPAQEIFRVIGQYTKS